MWTLHIISEGSDETTTNIDVVTVHDLNGHSESWYSKDPQTEKETTSQTPIYYVLNTSSGTINLPRRATDLLDAICSVRTSTAKVTRPLVFVGSGLGGTIIKQVIIIQPQLGIASRKHRSQVYSNSRQGYFVATPPPRSRCSQAHTVALIASTDKLT
ncbi:hypothetical protein FN846DRAFT_894448 [Sphaerosporella brunnea]|uniref:Uncharacterized protein n=1 Tax=Sphaerosporella brunnea TaxID=1250544 RepID=A0A5J5EJ04_9PEZI|nr:hypothetical protein FN846DRAFT_894448 [Sphaerosporella brunnea]